jgi:ubiquinone/menaquinone biosynthesis C-methylase UbiE/uncharacterized protein YbaR (Trm112 family)
MRIEELLVCPKCFGSIECKEIGLTCPKCHMNYNHTNGIPIMMFSDIYEGNRIESESDNIDICKDYVIDYYSGISKELESKYGRFIRFMNCGYAINENSQYSKINLKKERIERNSIKLLLEVVGNVDCNNKKVIEVGCGRGGNIFYLNKYFNPELIIGIDICFENVISCVRRKQQNSYFCVADAENIPFTAEYFDIAINIESSFHYPDLFKFYRNIYRILKRGGSFIYADVLPINRFQEIDVYLNSMNFEIIRNQDITSNVLLSFESMAANFLGVNERVLNDFLAFRDSRNYIKMKEGEFEYRIYMIRKT